MENGLAVASLIWWPDWPFRAFPRMRSDACGYPSWPGTNMFHSRAGYRSARPTFSKSSLSACNARPVHTVGPKGDIEWLLNYLVSDGEQRRRYFEAERLSGPEI